MAISGGDGSIILTTKVDTSGVEKGTRNLKSEAAKLAAEYRKAGMSQSEAMKKAWSEIERVNQSTQKTTQTTKKWGKQTEESGKRVKTAISGVGGAMKTFAGYFSSFLGIYALVNFSKEAVNLASDIEEVQNVVDVAFGDMSYKIEEFAKTSIESFGISQLTAKRTASTYMAMAKGMGVAEGVASDMAITMTGLTADLASFYNISQERADVILKSVYTGETETLKQLGIVMTEVNLENFAMSQGITKSIKNMTQQEKTMLRYQYVLEQTALAQGDFSRTQDSWANQTRILSERWKEMQATFGEAFKSIATLFLPVINTIIDGLSEVARYAKAVSSLITELFSGRKSSADTAQKEADAVKATTDNQKELTSAVKQTVAEQKKLLAQFDEIQILSGGVSGSSSDGGVDTNIPVLGGAKPSGEEKFEPQEYADKVKAALKSIVDYLDVALVAVGLLLIATGNIFFGAGFIIAGAYLYSVKEAKGEKPITAEDVNGMLDKIKEHLWLVLAAIGAIMLFMGNIFWGAGFIIAGAVAYGVKESKGNGEDVAGNTKNKLDTVMQAVGYGLIAIGVILMFTGHLMLGLGFVIAGKESVDVSSAKIGNDNVGEKINQFIEDNKNAILLSGAALLIIGAVLLGVKKYDLGVKALIGGVALTAFGGGSTSGESTKSTIQTWIDDNWGTLAAGGTGLVALGAFLIAKGNITTGMSLIALGAKTLESAFEDKYVGETIPVLGQKTGVDYYYDPLYYPPEPVSPTATRELSAGYASQATSSMPIIIELDGREFGRAVVDSGAQGTRVAGTTIIEKG